MKKYLLFITLAVLSATKLSAQTVSLSPSPVTLSAGSSVSLKANAASFPTGTKAYSWSSNPNTGVTIGSSGTSTKSITFSTVGTYIITVNVTVGTTSVSSNDTVNVVASGTRTYGSPVYAANIRGGHTMFGNTVMALYNGSAVNTAAMNTFSIASDGTTSTYGNDNSNMQFLNIDGGSSTLSNATSADLVLPAGTNTIKYARLYWGGHLTGTDFAAANLTTVKIRYNNASYQNVTIPASQVSAFPVASGSSTMIYQSYADVTSFLQNNGTGTYTIGNIPATVGSQSEGGTYGGWTIVVAYDNTALPYYSVRIYDAFLRIASGGSAQTVTLTNLNAPGNTLASTDAYLTTFAWEGDANIASSSGNSAGDYLQINGNTYSDAVNPANNMWNGTISNNGNFVTTTNPNFKNQMGIDLDQINVGTGYGISPNATSVDVTFGTEQDQYYPSVFAFSIRMKDPLVTINKTVTGSLLPKNSIVANETLTYTIAGQNTGLGDLSNATVVDSLPAGVTYVPGSMQIYSYPAGTPVAQTDNDGDDNAFIATAPGGRQYLTFYVGTGATASGGGVLGAGSQYQVKFLVTTPNNTNSLITVSNTAYITGTGSQAGASSATITNQSTAVISPVNSLPIKLSSFTVTKAGSDAQIRWTTQSELNNDHMVVERSTNGVNFENIATIAGNGTTSLTHNYGYDDQIGGLSGIIYYRLMDVDIDGNSSYSKVIALHLDGTESSASFSVYPNPFVSDLKVSIKQSNAGHATLIITNMSGQQVTNQPVTLQSGDNLLAVDQVSTLRPDIYVLELITADNSKYVQKIIKH